jgi:hypothetical protein
MRLLLLAVAAASAVLLSSCANDLTPETNDRPPAAFSADPMNHIPQPASENPLHGGGPI